MNLQLTFSFAFVWAATAFVIAWEVLRVRKLRLQEANVAAATGDATDRHGYPPASEPDAVHEWVSRRAAECATEYVRPRPIHSTMVAGTDAANMKSLRESTRAFTGVVVAIGVQGQDDSAEHRDFAVTLAKFVGSLAGERDGSQKVSDTEYLLACPCEDGINLHARFRSISEHLWSFQLSAPGELSIRCRWAAVYTRNESLTAALERASQQMRASHRH